MNEVDIKNEIPIYVISLADDIARREKLRKQFPLNYDSFQFIEAIDFRGRKKEDISHTYTKCKHNKKKPLTPTEVACALSHMKMMRIFLAGSHSHCLVLEDDIIGKDEGLIEATDILAKEDLAAGLIILGGQDPMKNKKFLSGRKTPHPKLFHIPYISRSFLYGTCCYIIDRDYARNIIALQEECLTRADDWKHLVKPNQEIQFKKIFRHPSHMKSSNIELDRSTTKDNLADLAKRNANKVAILILRSFRLLHDASR